MLNNPDNSSHAVFLQETLSAAQRLRIQLLTLNARSSGEIDLASNQAAKDGIQGLIVFDDPVLWGLRKQVVTLAANARLPVMYGYSEFVDEGGLISYGLHTARTSIGAPPPMWTGSSKAPGRQICRSSGRLALSFSSIWRRPERWASRFRSRCYCAPTG